MSSGARDLRLAGHSAPAARHPRGAAGGRGGGLSRVQLAAAAGDRHRGERQHPECRPPRVRGDGPSHGGEPPGGKEAMGTRMSPRPIITAYT